MEPMGIERHRRRSQRRLSFREKANQSKPKPEYVPPASKTHMRMIRPQRFRDAQSRRFNGHKRSQLFIGTHDETLSVAMCVNNPDCWKSRGIYQKFSNRSDPLIVKRVCFSWVWSFRTLALLLGKPFPQMSDGNRDKRVKAFPVMPCRARHYVRSGRAL